MVRAMSGLGDGCGFFKETCGIMTAAAARLSWYAGKGSDEEIESLLQIKWWDWPLEKITKNLQILTDNDIGRLMEFDGD